MTTVRPRISILLLVTAVLLMRPGRAAAHCDTMDGPVVTAARLALRSGDVTPVLKWVRPEDEAEIRAAFARTLKVRALSPDAAEVADRYFFETLVRIHRAGEGEPYSGLKPAGTTVEPGIAQADKALETRSPDALVALVTSGVAQGIRQRFARVQEAAQGEQVDVNAGRRYVAAYVEFIHYVENLHMATAGATSHGHDETHAMETSSPSHH